MKIAYPLKYDLKLLLFIFLIGATLDEVSGQDKALVSPKLDSVLNIVDDKIEKEEFERVAIVIDSLKQTKLYKKNKFDRLAVDLRYAKLLYKINENERAMQLLLKGFGRLKKHDNSKLICEYGIILAKIYNHDKIYVKGLNILDKNIKNATSRKDTLHLLQNYKLKAGIFFDMSRPFSYSDQEYLNIRDSIISNYRKIIAFPIGPKTKKIIGTAYSMLSNYEIETKNDSLAIFYIEKAIAMVEVNSDNLTLGTRLFNYGNIFYFQANYNDAIAKYKSSIDLLENIHSNQSLKIKWASFQNISWSYGDLKNYQKAYEWQEKAEILNDSLTKLNKLRDIAVIEAKYFESEKIELEKNKRLTTQLYFLGFALLSVVFGILGYIIYNRLLNKQRKTERKISGLKYKALNAQMSPHFINNLLMCIHDLIDTNEKEAAIENLDNFNRLTNLVLRSTKSNLIALSREIEILTLYMDLQLLRFDDNFDYDINTNKITKGDLDSIKIPPLILQPLVENSIVHGFRNMDAKGKLMIDFKIESDEYMICTITDNGTETPESLRPEMYSNNGISLKNINERLQLIAQATGDKDLVALTKIKNESNKEIGFRTELKIPLIYN